MNERACRRHIVLLGVGHTNAHIVRMWAMQPLPDTDLTCVSDRSVATYSGLLPAVLAGQLPPQAMEIDLVRLCAAAGARLITDRATGLDRGRQLLQMADHPPVRYDVLSIGIGSVPSPIETTADHVPLIAIKPMATFLTRLTDAVRQISDRSRPLQIAVVGGGAAGVEIAACLPGRLNKLTNQPFEITVVTRSRTLLPDGLPSTAARVRRFLQSQNHRILTETNVVRIDQRGICLDPDGHWPADLIIQATTAAAPPLLSKLSLPRDEQGFLLTDHTLRTTAGDPVFAVGDTGSIRGCSVPKAGVYAVRQGPVLWNNLQRCLDGQPLQRYRPQPSFLRLLNLGDGTAVGQWKGFSFQGRQTMRLKQFIDRRFMERYQKLPDTMTMPDDIPCRGCGCKLPADSLKIGLGSAFSGPEDAVVLPRSQQRPDQPGHTADSDDVLVSTDFFALPLPDFWLSGRIAALHAVSDLDASGARPFAAEAIVVLPEGDEATQQDMLRDLLSGARGELDRMGAELIGGHTITGPRPEAGFTVFGRPLGRQRIRKQGMRPGDRLFLTKPLGSGILLAAFMRGQCPHDSYECLLASMLRPGGAAAAIAVDCGVTAGTDVTGFGLLGHLQEMLTDDVAVDLQHDAIPLLPGTQAMLEKGIRSTLLPANRRFLTGVRMDRGLCPDLFLDPQTCGGLLLAVPNTVADSFSHRMQAAGMMAAEIGTVTAADEVPWRIRIR